MAHLQYMPGDPRLVDQLVYELKSKGIFDQFRKECIADVDTRPAYQNLRQRVETSVSTFLSRQTWKSDLNKNQLREKLRKHILDGNYLEQGVERIVDQVVNPKVASVFIPQVEDLVYNYLGIPRKRTPKAEQAEKSSEILLLTDLEAVSPGSVKSNDGESQDSEIKVQDMDIDSEEKPDTTEDMSIDPHKDDLVEVSSDSASLDKSSIPLPSEEIKLENIPAPEHSPKPAKIELESIDLPGSPNKPVKIELKNIELPREPNLSTDIPLPDEVSVPKEEDNFFKPIALQSENSNSSSGSSIRRNMSPLTPVRNFDDENSCDAQQAFENNSDENIKEPSSFRFNIEPKHPTNDSSDVKTEKKETDQLSYQFANQAKINTFNTPLYDDSSNSHNLQIDYESDANTNTSKTIEVKQEVENSEDSKKERKDDKKNHKTSHSSRDNSRHSSNKDKHSNSRDSSRHDKKSSSKDDKSKSSKEREKSRDRSEKKDSSKHRSSHKSSSSSKDKHRSSSSSHRHSSKSSDDRKTSSKDSSSKDKSSEKDKEKNSEKDRSSKDRKDSKSSSHRDKDRKSSKKDEKDKKKEKKATDDHCSSSGRGNHSRRSTDRDSNDGSSSSKGSQSHNNSKSTESKKESKSSSSKSDNTSTSGESTSPSDKEHVVTDKLMQCKPIVRVDNHLETPITNPPRLPFVPDVTLKKPKFANNFEEAKRMMKMRKFLAEEQKRMNQEAALLLEFQANVRPSLSQVYSSIPGPELEFACHTPPDLPENKETNDKENTKVEQSMKIDISDSEAKIKYKATDEHLERKQVTKDIINDIIGVPVEAEEIQQASEIIIKAEIIEIPNVSIEIEDPKNDDSNEENKPFSHLVDEISVFGNPENTIDPLEESIAEIVDQNLSTEFEITISTETLSEADVSEILEMKEKVTKFEEKELEYFAEHEKFNAELENHKFSKFLKEYIEATNVSNKMYLFNCDTYEENIVKEIASKFGEFEIVNYYKNGHLVPSKNIVKNVPLSAEISLPLDSNDYGINTARFSPLKSECSFELSSDYDAKLDEIVNRKSRQEVMEIILGGIIDESPSKMPTIDYYTEVSDSENTLTVDTEEATKSLLKRKLDEETVNINRSILTPNKIRKMSDSDQISSTTEETEEVSNNNKVQSGTRSKYLGRVKRVGLSRPKRCTLPNSPSSDKSVENYAQNTPTPPNGKLKATPRSKVQRYDTSDLYKPKLHYLSRRNNIS